MSRTLLGPARVGSFSVALLFEWRDLWVGVFVDPHLDTLFARHVDVYVSAIPLVPLRLTWWARSSVEPKEGS